MRKSLVFNSLHGFPASKGLVHHRVRSSVSMEPSSSGRRIPRLPDLEWYDNRCGRAAGFHASRLWMGSSW
jgi:hypothetical protein